VSGCHAFARRAWGVFPLSAGLERAGSRVQTVFWGVLVVGLSVALAVAGFAVVRRFLPMELRETHNANTAVIFGALYVMYGLVVGFSAYFVSYQYDNAQRIAEAEASSVQELNRLAEGSRKRNGGRCRGLPSLTPGPWWKKAGP
jgi:uncharacterized membrane protein YjfL (UPF0719 family)